MSDGCSEQRFTALARRSRMSSGGRRTVLLEKRAVIGRPLLSYLILFQHVRRDGVRAVEGARAEARC